MIRILRGIITVSFFVLFGLGGVILSYLVLPFVKKRPTAQKIVRWVWRVILSGFEVTRLIRVDGTALDPNIRGCVILANHPSLIDVIILTVLIPNTFSVAKASLRKNPFIGQIVRRVFLHDDARLMEEAPDILAAGYNILIFPEGTRSPDPKTMHPWHRGGTQLALRTHVPIQPVVLKFDTRMLAKGQNICDMGVKPVTITVKSLPQFPPLDKSVTNFHGPAVRQTRVMTEMIIREL